MADPIRPGATPLDQLQRWMLRAVSHPGGLDAGLAATREEGLWPEGADTLADIVPGNARLSPEEQLHIYAYAWFERLREALAVENPAAEHLLGAERFAELARAYLHEHPSTSTSLDHLGRAFAPWLDEQGLGAVADIVRVEQGMDRAFDQRRTEAVDPEALELPLDAWATARLRFLPGLQLLQLAHDVAPAMDAARADTEAPWPERRRTRVAVYCRDHRRYRMTVEALPAALLDPLLAGDTLGDALAAVAQRPEVDVEELLASVGGWFQQWARTGWIVGVET